MNKEIFMKYISRFVKETNISLLDMQEYNEYILFSIRYDEKIDEPVGFYMKYFYNTSLITFYGHEYKLPLDSDGKIEYDTFKNSMLSIRGMMKDIDF